MSKLAKPFPLFATFFSIIACAAAQADGELTFDSLSEMIYRSDCASSGLAGGVDIVEGDAFQMSGGYLLLDTTGAASNVVIANYDQLNTVDSSKAWIFEARIKELSTSGPSPVEGFGMDVRVDNQIYRLTIGAGEAWGNTGSSTAIGATDDDFHVYTMTYSPSDTTYSTFKDGSPIFSHLPVSSINHGLSFGDLTCHGNNGAYLIDYVRFSQVSPNDSPTAIAGSPISAHPNQTVTLDGTLSFDDNTASVDLLYSWSLQSPAGSSALLSNNESSTPEFTPDVAGSYTATLVVTDDGGLSSAASEVVISSDNLAPTAIIEVNSLVIIGTPVTLDGTGSTDPESDSISYQWSLQVPMGSAAVPADPLVQITPFTPDLEGTYDVQLIVSDAIGPSTPAVQIVVSTSALAFAESTILDISDFITALPTDVVTSKGNRKALLNYLSKAIAALQVDDVQKAVKELEKTIKRTDGCALNGSPDASGSSRDWITNCVDQASVSEKLTDVLQALMPQ